MKKYMTILFFTILFLVFSVSVLSHPAGKVILSVEGKVVHVTVNHNVGNSKNHFIDEILVFLNDKEIIKQIFFIQIDNIQDVSYVIPSVKPGDRVTVKTNCSRGGKRSATITVGITP